MKGYLMQVQPFSVNDGEGIRTTVFLAGCPLHCQWCSNPEGLDQNLKIGYYEKFCIECGACVAVCPNHIGVDLNAPENRKRCIGCGKCADVCVKHARKRLVAVKDADEIISEIKKHSLFFRKSGGGVTFSGGEATIQPDFLDELSEKLYDLGLDLAMETCGFFDFEKTKPILERMNLVFMDLKHMDSAKHKEFTGVGTERILENIGRLKEVSAKVVIRIPVIVGVNADEDNIQKSAMFVAKHLPKAKMELLPCHAFGFGKYEALGMETPTTFFATPKEKELIRLTSIIAKEGIEIVEYR